MHIAIPGTSTRIFPLFRTDFLVFEISSPEKVKDVQIIRDARTGKSKAADFYARWVVVARSNLHNSVKLGRYPLK